MKRSEDFTELEEVKVLSKRKKVDNDERSRNCPYLDTINRSVLDFDFEKLCSISLSNQNVYACLVCGKYFQGRGSHSHAYTHSVQCFHHVFINLHSLKFYCLPDDYEIIDSSLDDIKYVLDPTFSNEQIEVIDKIAKLSRTLEGKTYLPGMVGLNNIKANDYCNVILQALAHVVPLRNYFLQENNYKNTKRPPGDTSFRLVQRFGELIRKIWNPSNFKTHISPHEMLQAVVYCSKKQFQITEQGDPITFLSWMLNHLHMSLNGTKKMRSSIIYKTFCGQMRIYKRKVIPEETPELQKLELMELDEYKETQSVAPFLYLTLDLPPAPLYQDELNENIIPQVPLSVLLAKFDGTSEREYKTYKETFMKRFELIRLPRYLILYVKRFTRNNFFVEKNPTIVNFPIVELDMAEYLSSDPAVQDAHPVTTYNLVANIIHDGQPGAGKGIYRVHLRHRGSKQWYQVQDLHVEDILPQIITLSEAYIQRGMYRAFDFIGTVLNSGPLTIVGYFRILLSSLLAIHKEKNFRIHLAL
ncbi:U4/U6.U5 tri-snRNP-associated protein 2 [Trichoplax sp. H2]|uniref:Ubiquitin carboxyl-terminal hydrolase 39 n=1 Tax=Trichoplax adhaerens TaxID=10228 RepID=B3S4P2_TRIAD|nr:hypothetical protein TRIADDRAFT_59295 [Trichoplax adhaerens]EDV22247.1 hypothetical protein TRIADDRAFT_59295 [Trichoplax adhaerens]RDD46476.1 U4/U6.U5 tri-snRNP-associated protein 2 [Trichoplax sp. H2]|eukprot:XP_002115402.1 hypothetical protein TRIADDRAFT_59295 [Trichoplax adhaerens]